MLHTSIPAPPDVVSPAAGVDFARGRAHEITGYGRRVLGLLLAGAMEGPVLWLHSMWETDRLNGDGIQPFLEPSRLLFGQARTAPELLQVAEDVLRTGLIPLVVIELSAVPGLTPVRRLHLAAKTGGEDGRPAPLPILMTQTPGGAPGVETRWRLDPRTGGRWCLTRVRARTAPPESRDLSIHEGRIRFVED